MTSQELMEGVGELQRLYDRKYKGRDLNPFWDELLECSSEAFTRAVGEYRVMNYQRLPDVFELVQRVKRWDAKLGRVNDSAGVNPGAELVQLFKGLISGDIDEREYVAGLYGLADKYRNPRYAQLALEREAKLKRGHL